MADVFDEVEEQLRSDRYKTLAMKIAPWIIGALLLALITALAYWGWDNHRTKTAAKASETYAAGIEAFAQNDRPAATRAFEDVSKTGTPVYKALALMQLGGIRVEAGQTDEAVKLFDQAAELSPNEALADNARLKSAFALMDTAPYAEIEKRLLPLTDDKRPYRIQAKEALAFAKLAAGKTTEARSDFSVLTLLGDSSEEVRARARVAMEMIDSGQAKTLPEAVKAAKALPPMPVAPQAAEMPQ